MKKSIFLIFLLSSLLFSSLTFSQNTRRWSLSKNNSICWEVEKGQAHFDHIEMSGLQISGIINYGVNEIGELQIKKKLIFPMLRTVPNNTHASLITEFNDDRKLLIHVNGTELKEYPKYLDIRGKLEVSSLTNTDIQVTRTLFPSSNKAAFIEIIDLQNIGSQKVEVRIANDYPEIMTDASKGVYGSYLIKAQTFVDGVVKGVINKDLAQGEKYQFVIVYSGRKECEEPYSYSPAFELQKRNCFTDDVFNNLVLETPNDTINRTFTFAKLRTTESVFDTKGGLFHSPGGGSFYAGIWANDQAEYANPFFPFEGNVNANESAINSFRMFACYMNPDYKPIPSSIISEGVDIWNGAGDRGDMAMIAYGASRFALAYGIKETAKELWPLITWCFEYLERKKTSDGVIASDNDELEGRFPAGRVNLSTNSLAYGAYLSAAFLADDLGNREIAEKYRRNAQKLRISIEKYFGAKVQGFNTYRYYDENTKLRAWICLPLVMGISERKEETIKALFSDYLWTTNGILTESGSKTFWDRATLYAFRGLFASGATDKCMKYFSYYSSTRLLGEHVPYPVEAWPEGNQRHLAAESALYCRAVTEGLFGINPTGLNKFTVTPWLPKGWKQMKLKNIKAFNRTFDLEVIGKGNAEIVNVKLKNGTVITQKWDRKKPIEIVLP